MIDLFEEAERAFEALQAQLEATKEELARVTEERDALAKEVHEWRTARTHGVCHEELMAEKALRVDVEDERDAALERAIEAERLWTGENKRQHDRAERLLTERDAAIRERDEARALSKRWQDAWWRDVPAASEVSALRADLAAARAEVEVFARAVKDAEWAEGRGHVEESGCPWCSAAPYEGEKEHDAGCAVLIANAALAPPETKEGGES